jgi:hypothetical protein
MQSRSKQYVAARRSRIVFCAAIFIAACTKKEATPPPCTTVTITATTTASQPCTTDGKITVTAPLGAEWMYKIGNGNFQSAPVFASLLPGRYPIVVRKQDGCTSSGSIVVPETTPGPLFAAVKALLAANCLQCHSGPNPQAGHDFSESCTILTQWERIKSRAVDGNPSPMPQAGLLPAGERNKITNWINAGHRFTD